MAIPVWTVGEVLSASDVNSWFVPLAAYRTSTQSNSTTSFVNDNQLFFSVAANAVYSVELTLLYDGDSAADLDGNFTAPSGATLASAFTSCLSPSAASSSDDIVTAASSSPTFGCLGAGTNCSAYYSFTLTTSSTAGTLQWQFKQHVSSATATRVFAGSRLIAQRTG